MATIIIRLQNNASKKTTHTHLPRSPQRKWLLQLELRAGWLKCNGAGKCERCITFQERPQSGKILYVSIFTTCMR